MLFLAGCGPSKPAQVAPAPAPAVTFRDVSAETGIRFTHESGAAGRKYMPETMGAGCAFVDYDGDGWLDVLLVNGAPWPGQTDGGHPTLRLYRNVGGRRFEDVTRAAGLDVEMYGMGVAAGDYDNDGFEDLYITGVGSCRLFHNEAGPKGRRYRDVTAVAGVKSPGWATSATWIDYDRDGRLDLFVCHYVQWSPTKDIYFSVDGARKSYSTPQQYPGESCRLYHNDGEGRFSDVTQHAGIYSYHSKALGVVLCDVDQDGWPDLIVANDTEPNFLYRNQGDGTFKDIAVEVGIAHTETGKPKAGMGLDVGDDLNNGRESVVVTNFAGEQLTLYRKDEEGLFLDAAARSGIGNASQLFLGFGVFFFDYDSDGWQDIFVANGHIQDDIVTRQTGVSYKEQALLFHNDGSGSFTDRTADAGPALLQKDVWRGAAWGDYDNDGHPDILMTSNGGPARLLHNENHTGNHWLRIQLVGRRSNRDAIGARVRVRVGGRTMSQTVRGSSSYLSQSDRRPLFGLGAATKADEIDIQWPAGQVQSLGTTSGDRTVVVEEQ